MLISEEMCYVFFRFSFHITYFQVTYTIEDRWRKKSIYSHSYVGLSTYDLFLLKCVVVCNQNLVAIELLCIGKFICVGLLSLVSTEGSICK